jgi:hypothetical protein
MMMIYTFMQDIKFYEGVSKTVRTGHLERELQIL